MSFPYSDICELQRPIIQEGQPSLHIRLDDKTLPTVGISWTCNMRSSVSVCFCWKTSNISKLNSKHLHHLSTSQISLLHTLLYPVVYMAINCRVPNIIVTPSSRLRKPCCEPLTKLKTAYFGGTYAITCLSFADSLLCLLSCSFCEQMLAFLLPIS